MNKEVVMVAGSVPVTLFLLTNIGSSAAQISGGNDAAIRQALAVTSMALVAAAAATSSYATTFTTAATVALVLYSFRGVWSVPSVADVVPG